ncbi:asparaginase domain-containing protein [Rhodobacter capsulatus]|uniref:asparaginase domain-containing protein n=1 Tax=Rhodobacter capsulatus TaxID=1061 RepID=UPI004027C031
MPDLSGFVLTHGTGSLEETAFFLSCTWDLPVPLVLTGAQRPASALGSDGYMNFFQAACVAACPEAGAHGVLVVTHGEIHLPAEVTKTLNFGLDTFRAPVLGPVGLVTGETVRFIVPRPRRADLARSGRSSALPRVDIVLCHTGGDAVAIEAFLAAGRAGSWLRALPRAMPPACRRRLERWIKEEGGLVVIASRAQGMVMPNSRNDGHGFLRRSAEPAKARIMLQLALACGMKPPQIADVFR